MCIHYKNAHDVIIFYYFTWLFQVWGPLMDPWPLGWEHCTRLCVHTLGMSGMRSWYRDLISMSSVRWRFWAKVGVSRVAFSPFITTEDRRIKVTVLWNRITLRKQHDTFYKVCLMKASALWSTWAKTNQ